MRQNVVFLHTGGSAALFAYADQLDLRPGPEHDGFGAAA